MNSYGLPWRHGRQSDWLCAGKDRNRNVPVFGNLAAQFYVPDRGSGIAIRVRRSVSVTNRR